MTLTTTSRLLLLASIVSIATMAACKKSPPPQAPPKDTATLSSQLLTVHTILTLSRDTSMDAPDTARSFGIRDTIHGIIETRNATNGMLLSGRWYYTKTNQNIANNTARLSAGTNLSHFDLMNANPWVVGTYKLVVLIDSMPKDSVTFAIANKR